MTALTTVLGEMALSDPIKNPEKWLPIREAASQLGVHPHTIWQMSRKGLIRKWIFGAKKCKYSAEDVAKLKARNA